MDTPAPFPMLCWQLEYPDVTLHPAPDESVFLVRGWIAAPKPIEYLRFREPLAQSLLPLAFEDRPHVTEMYGIPNRGFIARCPYEAVRGHGPFTLVFGTEGREHEMVVPTARPSRDRAQLKREKLARAAAIARCPACHAEPLEASPDALRCTRCGARYPRDASRLDFLTPELRERFRIVATTNVSAGVYDAEALNIIYRNQDGLVLDCGAGLRDRYFPNVVNYEVVPYETTDVLGVGEELPFRDASFDAVFSLAVLEHVKDPFACAREILRVLKPGGKLYCQVPLLQPVHGYPNHYYNMTLTGLRNLFGEAIHVETAGPFLFGQPVFALSWILNRYVEGLPAERREAFKAMRVGDLMQPGDRYLGAGFVQALSPALREELSCCNAIVATKVR